MDNKLVLTVYKIGFAVLTFFAIGLQILYLHTNMALVTGNFFSFFTIESNIFAAIICIVSAWFVYQGRQSRILDNLRGAATLYMVITGVVYSALLAGADVQTPLPFVNAVLHYIFPVVVLADWLIDRPSMRVTANDALFWLSFPLVYVMYSLARGHITGWYPYPFLDVSNHGYLSVLVTSVVLGIGMLVLAWIIARLSYLSGAIPTAAKSIKKRPTA